MKKQLISEEFKRMQQLAGLQINENKNKLFEVLDNVTNAEYAADFIYDEIDKYIDSHEYYCTTYGVLEKLEKLLKVVSKKLNVELEATEKSNPLATSGTFFINGKEIFDYSNNGDYSSFSTFPDLYDYKAKQSKFKENIKSAIQSAS
jgi:hypothetical protein